MRKLFEYLIIIIIGVAAIVGLMLRSDSINKNTAKDSSNSIELFAKN